MKVKIYTFPDKRPDFIELQKKSIDNFLKDDYEYIIINNGSNNESRKEIFDICNNNGIKHIYVENPNHSDPNIACAYPINQTLDKYIKVEEEKDIISVIIDSDMFFISDFSIVDFIGDNEVSAIYQVRGDVNYLWNGIVFINNSKVIDIESFDFGYQTINGNPTDVGGNMYFYLKEHPDCKVKYIYHTSHIKAKNNNLDSLPDEILKIYDDSFCYEIIEKSILHYGRGSNWDNMAPDYHKRKTELLHFFVNGCLNNEIKAKNVNPRWREEK